MRKEEYRIHNKNNSRKLNIVFDTSAFLAKYHLQLPRYIVKIYTVPRVVDEVRDQENKEALELGIETKMIEVIEPREDFRRKTIIKARKIGEHVSLSKTDIDVAALSLQLKTIHDKVIVFTDDYSLQNLLYHMGIPFKPLRTKGIRKARKYRVYCPVCGYVPADPSEDTCPICGSKLVKKHMK
ncbi:Nucleotide binding protein, PINc [Staphylothermus marinus F1]|uniref:Nucleotide binding protein, PINc n=1 Tax=Staphylothermus marinus (strain ATCC 43588 / DSM 3639 / JCM 9404 / F1) TaxID=399550 RepID=A3DMG7_STAMF|nr:Nucleotide binding protein, PINc [Staphylothermus marinus F1]